MGLVKALVVAIHLRDVETEWWGCGDGAGVVEMGMSGYGMMTPWGFMIGDEQGLMDCVTTSSLCSALEPETSGNRRGSSIWTEVDTFDSELLVNFSA